MAHFGYRSGDRTAAELPPPPSSVCTAEMDITEIRKGDIVTWAGQQWRVIRWTHDKPGIYSCDLEPIGTAPDLEG